jgi:ribosomal-protein-alanine N-acetyltransferase
MAPALAFFSEDHGKQFAPAASKSKALHRGWDELKLHRLEANIQPGNTPSIELVKSLGFHNEGFSPRSLKLGGRWRDHERWAILSK